MLFSLPLGSRPTLVGHVQPCSALMPAGKLRLLVRDAEGVVRNYTGRSLNRACDMDYALFLVCPD